MYTVGIVAEFDPFHKGHEHLIRQARCQGATHIVVCMSGAAVQRGEIAVCSKHERAKIAVECGADLVVELPAPYSCSAAKNFAEAATDILTSLSIDALAFGTEYDDTELLNLAAQAAQEMEHSSLCAALIREGVNYPEAIYRGVREQYGESVAKVLLDPNSTLAVEYIKALKQKAPDTRIIPIKRIGAAHGADHPVYPSAAAIRELLSRGEDISAFVPCVPDEIYSPSLAEDIIMYAILTADKDRLCELPELSTPLADRIMKIRRDPPDTLHKFLESVKTRNYTFARLKRSVLHLVLGVKKSDLTPPPYIRILSFNERGSQILRHAETSLPLSVSLRELEKTSERAARVCEIENRAVKLQQMCSSVVPAGGRFTNEYKRKITILR